MAIREAQPGDARSIADLHIRSWRDTYPGILPAGYLSDTIVHERRDYWQQAFKDQQPGEFVLLMPGKPQPLGFISVLRNREPGYDGLIDNLHVLPGQTGQGLGRQLLGAAAERLVETGAGSVCLWVFDANRPTVRFYERLGGLADEHGIDEFAGARAPHSRLGWTDLDCLIRRCRTAKQEK